MHRLPLCLFALTCCLAGVGQKSYGVGQDYYLYRKGAGGIVPSLYYQSNGGWYGQMRYNYEEEQTVSFHVGKTISKEGAVSWSVTPQAGLLAGRFSGGSVNVLATAEKGIVSFFTEPQYCLSWTDARQSFFYNWSELCVQPLPFLYGGAAVQQTALHRQAMLMEPGLVAGIVMNNVELPVYFFKPKGSAGYFVVGLHWKLRKG